MCLSENELVSRIFKELLCINKKNTKILKKGKDIKERNTTSQKKMFDIINPMEMQI